MTSQTTLSKQIILIQMTDRRFINHHSLNQQGLLVDVNCRFCRTVQKYNKWTYVAFCGCYSHSRYVHRQCAEKWIILKFQHVYNNDPLGDPEEFNVFCQKCQQRVEIEFVITQRLTKYQKFIQKLSSKKILLVVLLTLLTFSIIGMIIFSILANQNSKNIPPSIIVGLSLSAVIFCIIITVFILKFLLIKSIYITYMANNKQQPKIMGIEERNIDQILKEEVYMENAHFGTFPKVNRKSSDKQLMLQSRLNKEERLSKISEKQSVASKTLTDYVMKKMYTHDQIPVKGDREPLPIDKKERYSRKTIQTQPIMKKDQSIQISNIPKENKSIQYSSIYNKDQQANINVRINPPAVKERSQINNTLTSKTFRNGKEFSFQNRSPSPVTRRKKIFSQNIIGNNHNLPESNTHLLKQNNNKKKILQDNRIAKIDDLQNGYNFYRQKDAEEEFEQPYCKDPIYIKEPAEDLNINSKPTSILDQPPSSEDTNHEQSSKENPVRPSKLQLKNKNDPIKIKLHF